MGLAPRSVTVALRNATEILGWKECDLCKGKSVFQSLSNAECFKCKGIGRIPKL